MRLFPKKTMGAGSTGDQKGLRGWMRRHRVISGILIGILVIVLVVAAAFFVLRARMQKTVKSFTGQMSQTSFIRTTTLSKGTLSDTVSATGTVESSNVSSVTTNLNYTVKSIAVQVGDKVSAGDVICVLDSSDLEDQIAKQKESLSKTVDKAADSVTEAQENYDDAVAAAEEQEATYASAQTALNTARAAYQKAEAAVTDLQAKCDTAQAQATAAGDTYAAALNGCKSTVHSAEGDGANACTCYEAKEAYDTANAALQQTQSALQEAKQACNYDTLYKNYSLADETAAKARTRLDELEETVTRTQKELTSAQEKLEESSSNDQLEELEEQLEKCTLTAATSGTVTAVNATVGNICQGTVATIQDTEDLTVSFTVYDYDIDSLALGQKVLITSDAADTEIVGHVSMLAPTANQSGSFAAECTVDGGSNGLYIGMSVSLEIVLSSVNDVYIVPIDAVGTDSAGNSVVYEKTGGAGTEAIFEEVAVTIGASNDYYIEISGSDLYEGMEIRAAADEAEATTTLPEESEEEEGGLFASLFGGGNMPGGGFSGGDMPSGGFSDGDMPSGGFSGGDMPSGGFSGGMPSGGMPGGNG